MTRNYTYIKMESQDIITLSAMKFISGENVHICRLCFAPTENEEYSLEDCVRLEKLFMNESLSFADMFSRLGVADNPELPTVICMNCATSTINSYLFQKLCYYSNDRWQEAVNKLDGCIAETDFSTHNIESAYFLVSENSKMIITSKKKIKKDKTAVLDKIKKIMAGRARYAKRKKKPIKDHLEDGMDFDSSNTNKKHIKRRTEEKLRIPCPQCAKFFGSQWQLKEHAERIHYPKTLQCSKCAQMFSTEKILRRHEKNSHVSVYCKLCLIQFPSQIALRGHLDKHEMNTCSNCSKKFLNKQSFRQHLKICGAPKPKANFYCDICGKGYVRKNGMRSHLKTDHGFGSVHSCSWCGKKFDAISRLRNHIVKHTRERNFYCEHCGSKFVTKAALVYHTRLHTGERPFPCDLCDESFLSASRRMEHKRRKHWAPTKECSICPAKFVTGHQLRKHEKRHFDPQSKFFVPNARTDVNYNREISLIPKELS